MTAPLNDLMMDYPLTLTQFFERSRRLWAKKTLATRVPGRPLFQAATANLNLWAKTRAVKKNADRGPLLVVTGEKDNIVPFAMANAAYKLQRRNRQAST